MAVKRRENIFVFDIETIPDHEAAINLTGISESKSIQEKRKALTDYHLEITDGKNDFLRQLFHKVVCISFLEAQIDYDFNGEETYKIVKFDTASTKNSSEEEVIKWFWNNTKKTSPRFISFNGKMFDMPVLKYRALKYGISCDWFFQEGDKWENYNQKYGTMHTDLIDCFSDYGISAKIKMKEICALLNIPCKLDVDGGGVTEMYDAGQIDEIRDYCETDVLATYILYLKFCHLSGRISRNSLRNEEDNLLEFLKNNKKEKIQEFLLKWKR